MAGLSITRVSGGAIRGLSLAVAVVALTAAAGRTAWAVVPNPTGFHFDISPSARILNALDMNRDGRPIRRELGHEDVVQARAGQGVAADVQRAAEDAGDEHVAIGVEPHALHLLRFAIAEVEHPGDTHAARGQADDHGVVVAVRGGLAGGDDVAAQRIDGHIEGQLQELGRLVLVVPERAVIVGGAVAVVVAGRGAVLGHPRAAAAAAAAGRRATVAAGARGLRSGGVGGARRGGRIAPPALRQVPSTPPQRFPDQSGSSKLQAANAVAVRAARAQPTRRRRAADMRRV